MLSCIVLCFEGTSFGVSVMGVKVLSWDDWEVGQGVARPMGMASGAERTADVVNMSTGGCRDPPGDEQSPGKTSSSNWLFITS